MTTPPTPPRFQALIQSLSALSELPAEPGDAGLLLQAG